MTTTLASNAKNFVTPRVSQAEFGGRHVSLPNAGADKNYLRFKEIGAVALEDVPRVVDFRRRSWCDGQAVRTIVASLLEVWAASSA